MGADVLHRGLPSAPTVTNPVLLRVFGGRTVSELDDRRALRQAIIRIELFSQAPAATLERSSKSSEEAIGGRCPKGGISVEDDFAEGFALRSAEYYWRRLAKCYTHRAITELLSEALATLDAWQRTPIPKGKEPEYGSPQWKRYIAESDEDAGVLASRYWNPTTQKNVTRRYINMIRKQYRDAA